MGTDSKVQFMEPTYQFPNSGLGACGEMSLRAEDSQTALKIGRNRNFFRSVQISCLFPRIFNDKVKNLLSADDQRKNKLVF